MVRKLAIVDGRGGGGPQSERAVEAYMAPTLVQRRSSSSATCSGISATSSASGVDPSVAA
jgi:hypothetical protein